MGYLANLAESARERLGIYPRSERTQLMDSLGLVRENLAQAALRRENNGWAKIGDDSVASEFTAQQRTDNATLAREYAVANPLAKNGLSVRQAFVWGTGVGISAADETVNEVIQEFLDDTGNRSTFAGHQAHLDLEQGLGTDGNVFLACFTDPRTGRVQVRTLPFTQVTDIITNPEDSTEPWFYLREWTERRVVTGESATVRLKQYYPALQYQPAMKPRRIDNVEVRWDAPVYHVKDNGNPGWLFGVPDLFPVVSWLRGYTGMLNDWAKLSRALSTIAYKISGKTRNDTMAARAAIQSAYANGQPGGAIATTNAEVEAMPKTGANIEADGGLPLARMVAAGLGLPITLLIGDPGVTGARAVAETLTQPMVLNFKNRRELWTECIRAILNHVIDSSINAPLGTLTGKRVRDGHTIRYDLPDGVERTLIIEWPEIEDTTLTETVDAVVKGLDAGIIPPETGARLVLRGLRVRDVDEVVESMKDDEGNFLTVDDSQTEAMLQKYNAGEI